MRDKFTVDFDRVAHSVLPKRAYRLADVEHRIERVAYDLVRFRDNEDTDQLWKVQEGTDGPVIVALYGEDGNLVTESNTQPKNDWEAVPDKKAMHIYYKGEPLVSLGSDDIGIPSDEFNLVRRWLPAKLASDESLQIELLGKAPAPVRALIAKRFPELTKVAGTFDDEDISVDWNPDDLTSDELIDDDPPNWIRQNMEPKDFDVPYDMGEPEEEENTEEEILGLLEDFKYDKITKEELVSKLIDMVEDSNMPKLMDVVEEIDISNKAAAITGLTRMAMEPEWEDELEETQMAMVEEWDGMGPPEASTIEVDLEDEEQDDIDSLINKLQAKIEAM